MYELIACSTEFDYLEEIMWEKGNVGVGKNNLQGRLGHIKYIGKETSVTWKLLRNSMQIFNKHFFVKMSIAYIHKPTQFIHHNLETLIMYISRGLDLDFFKF